MKEGLPRLLLIGGGHAHLEVVRRLARCPDVSATLVNPDPWAAYSGMLPGLVAGHYRAEQTRIDLAGLCERSGVTFVRGRVVGLRAAEALCANGARHAFDVVSLDTGAAPRLADLPGALEHAVPVKPVPQFLERWQAFCASLVGHRSVEVVVIGSGAGGVELSLAMQHWLARTGASSQVALVSERCRTRTSLLPATWPPLSNNRCRNRGSTPFAQGRSYSRT